MFGPGSFRTICASGWWTGSTTTARISHRAHGRQKTSWRRSIRTWGWGRFQFNCVNWQNSNMYILISRRQNHKKFKYIHICIYIYRYVYIIYIYTYMYIYIFTYQYRFFIWLTITLTVSGRGFRNGLASIGKAVARSAFSWCWWTCCPLEWQLPALSRYY